MTPNKLVQLRCPQCQENHWEIDSDYRGMDGLYVPYSERFYYCPACKTTWTGYTVVQQSPPSFFIQPHKMYPMKKLEFDHWLEILRQNFPEHPMLKDAYRGWYPSDASEPADLTASSRIQTRPAQIARATGLLCLGLAIGSVKLIIAWRLIESAGADAIDFPFTLTTFLFALNVVLIWKIWQGRNWARTTLLVIFIIGVLNTATALEPKPGFRVSRSLAILQVAQLAISLHALLLIYGSKAKGWFQSKKTQVL
jgi:hypothetical protein